MRIIFRPFNKIDRCIGMWLLINSKDDTQNFVISTDPSFVHSFNTREYRGILTIKIIIGYFETL